MVYCPDFPFNIVFFQGLKKRGINWSHQYRIFIVSGDIEPLRRIRKIYKQYVLEYRPVSKIYTATIITAGIRRPLKRLFRRQSKGVRASVWVSMDLWYKRLGHIGPLALFKVGENSLGVRLRGPSITKYRDYTLSKICQQVSYRLDPNKFIKPF